MDAANKFPKMDGGMNNGQSAGAGPAVPESSDSQLANGQKDRTYNPVDGAKRGSIGAALNEDAARFKKGPGPL